MPSTAAPRPSPSPSSAGWPARGGCWAPARHPRGVDEASLAERLRARLADGRRRARRRRGPARIRGRRPASRASACTTERPAEMAVVAATRRVAGTPRRRGRDRRLARPPAGDRRRRDPPGRDCPRRSAGHRGPRRRLGSARCRRALAAPGPRRRRHGGRRAPTRARDGAVRRAGGAGRPDGRPVPRPARDDGARPWRATAGGGAPLRHLLDELRGGHDDGRRALAAGDRARSRRSSAAASRWSRSASRGRRGSSPEWSPGGGADVRWASVPAAALLPSPFTDAHLDAIIGWLASPPDRLRVRDRLRELAIAPWSDAAGDGALLRLAAARAALTRLAAATRDLDAGRQASEVLVAAGGAWAVAPGPAVGLALADALRRPGVRALGWDHARLLAPLGTIEDPDERRAVIADLRDELLLPLGSLVLPAGLRSGHPGPPHGPGRGRPDRDRAHAGRHRARGPAAGRARHGRAAVPRPGRPRRPVAPRGGRGRRRARRPHRRPARRAAPACPTGPSAGATSSPPGRARSGRASTHDARDARGHPGAPAPRARPRGPDPAAAGRPGAGRGRSPGRAAGDPIVEHLRDRRIAEVEVKAHAGRGRDARDRRGRPMVAAALAPPARRRRRRRRAARPAAGPQRPLAASRPASTASSSLRRCAAR